MTDDPVSDEPAIHIHEDDRGMRRLHPLAATAEVTDDLRAARAAEAAHRAPDGTGWTDVHVIRDPDHDYTTAGLTFAQADAALAPIMPRVRRFTATASAGFADGHDPFGSYEDDARCYGLDESCFVKLDGDQLDGDQPLVRYVWFQADTRDPDRLAALRRALVAIDAIVASVIADHWIDRVGPIGDDAFLDDYMGVLAE